MTDLTLFRAMIQACGLTPDEASVVLGISTRTVNARLRTSGNRPMTQAEADILAATWTRINRGEVDGLPDGCRVMSHAIRLLRGAEGMPDTGRARRGSKPTDQERALVAAYEAVQAMEAKKRRKPKESNDAD